MKNTTKKLNSQWNLALVCIAVLSVQTVRAQVTLSGTSYTQNFNTLSNGLPAGWSVRTNATATSLGAAATFPTAPKSWADGTGEFGNCPSLTNNAGGLAIGSESAATQGTFTNRILGVRQTGPFGDPGAAFVFQITNTAGLSSLILTVNLNLVKSNGCSTTWTIDYGVGNSPAVFTPLGTYADPGAIGSSSQSFALGADANNQPGNVWIRFAALSVSTGSGSRDTFGIDNFSLAWISAVPPAITSIAIVNGEARIDFTAGTGDLSSSFGLFSSADVQGTYTDTAATITSPGLGLFRAVCAVNGPQQFYYVKRQ